MAPPDKLPPHQAPGQQNWVYPSEQMFYNAMKRKVGRGGVGGGRSVPGARRCAVAGPGLFIDPGPGEGARFASVCQEHSWLAGMAKPLVGRVWSACAARPSASTKRSPPRVYAILQGWDPQAEDMRSVVGIHNTVNEQAWHQVLAWERLHCDECATPRLKRFQGRPSDLSPKARLLNFVVGWGAYGGSGSRWWVGERMVGWGAYGGLGSREA